MPQPALDPNRPDAEPAKVQGMFASIAGRYDLANHLLSGGMDYLWRRRASALVKSWKPKRILDLATGSGDLMHDLQIACPDSYVVGADFCTPMLAQARKKGLDKLVGADALALPFRSGAFDAVTIGFGFRNMNPWRGALAEIHRVLAPGGRLLILDFSLPRGVLRGPYRWYLHRVLPKIADACTGSRGAYEYLADSIEKFPRGGAMLDLLSTESFYERTAVPLTFGVVSIYTGRK